MSATTLRRAARYAEKIFDAAMTEDTPQELVAYAGAILLAGLSPTRKQAEDTLAEVLAKKFPQNVPT